MTEERKEKEKIGDISKKYIISKQTV